MKNVVTGNKMKRKCFLMAALACAALFFACTGGGGDKNDEEAMLPPDVELPDGDGGDLTDKRLVHKITEWEEDSEYPVEYVFEYDEDRRVVKIVETDYGYDETVTKRFIYSEDEVEMRESEEFGMIFKLENDRVATTSYIVDGWSDVEYEYSYSEGYLSKIDYMGPNDSVRYEIENGDLVTLYWNDDEYAVTPSSVDNNANIDLFGFIDCNEIGLFCGDDGAFFLGLCGKSFEHLPSEIEQQTSGFYALSESFDYEVDKDGYVTKITLTEREGDTRNVYVFDIEYVNGNDEESDSGIVGEWSCLVDDETGLSDETKYVMVFENDGTGSMETIAIEGGKETAAVRLYFEYILSKDEDGDLWLEMVDSEGISRYQYELSATGLTLYADDEILEFKRQ